MPTRALSRPFLPLAIALVALIGWAMEDAQAASYYVALNGNDGSPGTEAAPFRTLARGVSVLAPGDILYVKQGTYAESLYRNIPPGESWDRPVIVAAYPGHTVTLRPPAGAENVARFEGPQAFIVVDGLILDGVNVAYDVVKITGEPPAHHIRLQNCEIMNSRTGHGVLINGDNAGYNEVLGCKIHDNGNTPDGGTANHGIYVQSDHNLIEGNDIYNHALGHGIQAFGGSQSFNIFRRNWLHDNGDAGILVYGDGNQIVLNQIWRNGGWGIAVNRTGNLVAHNVIDQHTTGIGLASTASGTQVYNNIIQRSGGYPNNSIMDDSPGADIRRNLLDRGISRDAKPQPLGDNLQGDARFVNADARDYHLHPDSPAREAGLAVDEVPTDFAGETWTDPPSVGAYANGASGTTVAAVLPLSRSVQTGILASAFGSIINTGTAVATNCRPAAPASPPAGLGSITYQTTDVNNNLTGTPNTPADIAPGAVQNFVFGFIPTGAIAQTSLAIRFQCDNVADAPSVVGVNNLFIVASASPVPDTIVITMAVSNDGIVHIPESNGVQVFAIATSNVGATGTITVSADTNGVALPVSFTVCETNLSGTCVAPPVPTITVNYPGGTNKSFAFFARASGSIPLNPAANRAIVRLRDGSNVLRGASSVALCTAPNAGC